MRIVIAGGGTGGHTSAGLAVAAALAPRAEIHWIGSARGIEARRAPAAGLPYHSITTGKLRRYWDRQNVLDLAVRVPLGIAQSWRLLRRLRPAVVFATGGFVALPPALAARVLRIPLVIHEQTAVPGLANRIAARVATRIAVTFGPAPAQWAPGRVTVTGNPLRPELRGGSREGACRQFALDPGQPLVYVTGGAQGASRINRTVGEVLLPLLEAAQVIHQCGDNQETGDRAWLLERAGNVPAALRDRYVLLPWVGPELRHVYAAADVVVSRSGAGTVNECCQLGVPAIFIPLPGAGGDEQTANARLVAERGGAVLLPQADLTPPALLEAVTSLLADPARRKLMAERARELAVPDAAERLARLILEAARP
jgi:UDP-N-acetylglucosamine--N-acetylmuramyl-(pentapeptide) pyrophosphoryl-undecaprenol N-acetylglucosamine transferase